MATAARRQVFTAGRREFALFAAIYLLYDAARWAWAGHLSLARAHAHRVIALERALHIAVEGSVQRALDSGVPSFVLSNIYLAAQAVVLPAALIWLYRRSPGVYRHLRGTVVITWLIATPIFALYPVAPPRLAGIGITDTVSHQALVTLTGHSTLFYNPYAAVPSLRVGLAFAIGIAAAAALHRRWSKALALLWGPLVTLAVIATGNHYFFDAATGLLVAAVAFAATRVTDRSRVKLSIYESCRWRPDIRSAGTRRHAACPRGRGDGRACCGQKRRPPPVGARGGPANSADDYGPPPRPRNRGRRVSVVTSTSDRRRAPQRGSSPAELVERIEKLAGLLATSVQETVAARREAVRLRKQNETLRRRVAELETRFELFWRCRERGWSARARWRVPGVPARHRHRCRDVG